MLITPFYNGQGLGNQLANYITTRCLALDKGYEFRVAFPERFKGYFFTDIYLPEIKGIEVPIEGEPPTKLPEGIKYYKETSSDYDDFVLNIPDDYMIHGNLQGEKYFEKHKDEIREWLKVEPLEMPDDLCIINFRGGEYKYVPSFFLPKSYWDNAIKNMRKINPDMKFEVHTDDPETARQFFDFPIVSGIELNWRAIRYAKYLLLSNSTFAIFPAWLNRDVKLIIAPKYFARYNTEEWFLLQNCTSGFTYQDKHGKFNSYNDCMKEIYDKKLPKV